MPSQATRFAVRQPFNPYTRPGIAARFDAWDLTSVTVNGSNFVSQWSDKSGNGRHLVQASGPAQPLLQVAPRANNILFDGLAQYLKASAFTLNQPTTVYFVGKQVTWVTNATIHDGNSVNTGLLRQYNVTPNINTYAGSFVGENTGWAVGQLAVVSSVYNGSASSNRINKGVPVTGNAGASNFGGFTLGVRGDIGAGWANVAAYEIIIMAVADSLTAQNQMVTALGRKWGIAV